MNGKSWIQHSTTNPQPTLSGFVTHLFIGEKVFFCKTNPNFCWESAGYAKSIDKNEPTPKPEVFSLRGLALEANPNPSESCTITIGQHIQPIYFLEASREKDSYRT
jgi:hypothetical protein